MNIYIYIYIYYPLSNLLCFPGGSDGKRISLQCSRPGLNPWVRKIPWRKDGYPLQYSCLENFMDGGAWQATDHGLA